MATGGTITPRCAGGDFVMWVKVNEEYNGSQWRAVIEKIAMSSSSPYGYYGYTYYLNGTVTVGGHVVRDFSSFAGTHGVTIQAQDTNYYYNNFPVYGPWVDHPCSWGSPANVAVNVNLTVYTTGGGGGSGTNITGSGTLTLSGPAGHNYSNTVVSPTCTANGYTSHTCIYCGSTYTDATTAALGHDSVYGGTSSVHRKCSRCGVTLVSTHSYSQSTQVSATCTEKGTSKYTCSCGYNYTEQDIAALGHSYAGTVTSPTCTSQGYTSYKCSRCNDTSKANDTYTAALGHDYVGTVTTPPTYTASGEMTYICSRCSDSYMEEIARKLGAVRIKNETGFRPHLAYVRTQNGWVLCVPNVRKSDNTWKPCG